MPRPSVQPACRRRHSFALIDGASGSRLACDAAAAHAPIHRLGTGVDEAAASCASGSSPWRRHAFHISASGDGSRSTRPRPSAEDQRRVHRRQPVGDEVGTGRRLLRMEVTATAKVAVSAYGSVARGHHGALGPAREDEEEFSRRLRCGATCKVRGNAYRSPGAFPCSAKGGSWHALQDGFGHNNEQSRGRIGGGCSWLCSLVYGSALSFVKSRCDDLGLESMQWSSGGHRRFRIFARDKLLERSARACRKGAGDDRPRISDEGLGVGDAFRRAGMDGTVQGTRLTSGSSVVHHDTHLHRPTSTFCREVVPVLVLDMRVCAQDPWVAPLVESAGGRAWGRGHDGVACGFTFRRRANHGPHGGAAASHGGTGWHGRGRGPHQQRRGSRAPTAQVADVMTHNQPLSHAIPRHITCVTPACLALDASPHACLVPLSPGIVYRRIHSFPPRPWAHGNAFWSPYLASRGFPRRGARCQSAQCGQHPGRCLPWHCR